MPETVLLYADSLGQPDLFALAGFLSGDPYTYLERDGRRVLVVPDFELDRARRESGEAEIWSFRELGLNELVDQGLRPQAVRRALVQRAVERFGATSLTVPPWLPVSLADHLRANGINVEIDDERWRQARRVKDDEAVAATREAVAATEQALALIRDHLVGAVPAADGTLTFEGAPLTSERLQGEVRRLWSGQGLESEVPIIAGGTQSADAHETGHGPLRARQPIICDLFPRHSRLRYHADMTRTFCVGEPPAEILEWHALAERAIRDAAAAVRPGITGAELHRTCSELFRDHGVTSDLFPVEGDRTARFDHALGHGLGLAVHEAPSVGRGGREELVPGDIITLEPGLYRNDLGGVRLEDDVLVTEDGSENLCRFPYDLVVA
jgi:Xaa-Pro aminopeptidase